MTGIWTSAGHVDPTKYKRSDVWDTGWAQNQWNTKPYAQFEQNMGEKGNEAFGQFMGMSKVGMPGSTGFGGGIWGAGYPDMRDPNARSLIKSYEDEMMGNERTATQNYVNQAANLGVRGGYGPVGGPSARTALMHDAIGQLAGGATDRFKTAMGYGEKFYGAQTGIMQSILSSLAQLAPQLFGLQKGAIDADTARMMQLIGMRREDANADVAAQQDWETKMIQVLREQQAFQQASEDRERARLENNELQQLINTASFNPQNSPSMTAMNRLLLNPRYMAYNRGGNVTLGGTGRGPMSPDYLAGFSQQRS